MAPDAADQQPDGGLPELPEAVDRWELAGGTWRVAAVGEGSALVELLRCDGGEVVERLMLDTPSELRWARHQLTGE